MDRFGQLLSEQIPRLRRYARALAGDAQQADDLVQDCLERAWSRAHQWRAGSDLCAWLFTVMHNLFVNQVRRLARAPDSAPLQEDVAGRADAPEHAVQRADLSAALAQLPPPQREVLLLVALEGMSYEETAAILDLPLGTVMSRLYRARERMRGLLAGDASPPLRRVK